MEILKKLAFCILASVLLTACGGGDTSSNTEVGGVNTESTSWDNAQWDKATWK